MDWNRYENEARNEGFCVICGVDEAGRGPLAGPVFAAAVVLPPDADIPGLNDSKKLTAAKRDALFDAVCQTAIEYAVASASEREIDDINILNATFLAMRRAVELLRNAPDIVLVDGNRAPALTVRTRTIIKGDALSASIAAASILAKVSRDRHMDALARHYPEYDFERHKGYGTKLHYEKLAEFGASPVHRRSFLKNMDRAAR